MTVSPPIPFAGSLLDEARHVCAFFNSEEEEYRVLLPFIKEGFERGDKAVHVVNPDKRDYHLRRGSQAAARNYKNAMDRACLISRSDAVTLIQGETGTGKRVIARALHRQSAD